MALDNTKTRVYLWDNVKTLLIFLVVAGHFVTQFTGKSEFMQSMFVIIYSFHMPLFIFVSGLFSKSSLRNGKINLNKVLVFVILYLALKLVIFLEGLAFGKPVAFRPFYEQGIPWYMLAMAAYLCMSHVFRNVPPKLLIPVTVFIACIAGYEGGVGDVLALSRIIVFYPIFLAGYFCDSVKVAEFSRKPALRISGAVILIALVVLAFVAKDSLYPLRPLVTGRSPFSDLPIPALGFLYRFLHYIVGGVVSFAVICVLPNKENKLSYIGAATLPIYFLHRPILYIIMDSGLGKLIVNELGDYGVYVFLAISIPLTFLLSFPPLAVPFNKLMKCKFGGVFDEG